eukprot:gnl/TRDRNA2_/TRDRNA2_27853_c0_seq1.p1 gnl/TRDRNA2_/TRDRNA2_27853_c0~~gnl/TRDRNA2_/TRDRNA2_27853_c0_seq1.p1  ORF type:complete len:273 (-),score=36.63 gnl/TRDRNA2_/TRDRNA2_27853_c0_seq1:167-985(-)
MADDGGGGGNGFAMEGYTVPKCTLPERTKYGTMPKAKLEAGGMFASVKQRADAAPGPEKYFKDMYEKSWTAKSPGGSFSKVGREGPKPKNEGPAVGTYDTQSSQVVSRTTGGLMSKTDRTSVFWDEAQKNCKNSPAPGKYDPVVPQSYKVVSPRFHNTENVSRNPTKPSTLGPGVYNVSHKLCEKRTLTYSSSKGSPKSYLDSIVKAKEKLPAPGHKGVPDSKVIDTVGTYKHCAIILNDRARGPMPARMAGSHIVSNLSTPMSARSAASAQ